MQLTQTGRRRVFIITAIQTQRPTLPYLYQFYPDKTQAAVPLLSRHSQMEGHGTHVVSAGEAFTEVINTWHNGRNLGSTPAKFLIVFAGQDGTPITIRP